MHSGRLIYLIGASGSGKDSLITYAREHLASNAKVQFAHRFVTRPNSSDNEHAVHLSEAEFKSRVEAGLLGLHWSAHGFHYGVGSEINAWLCKGITVVVNGSREYLPRARVKYPELIPVEVKVSEEQLVQRLKNRARESMADIASRLTRNSKFALRPGQAIEIDSSHDLTEACQRFVKILQPEA